MANQHTPEINPQNLKETQNMWEAFVQNGKYAVILIALVLVGLALGFVKFT